MVDFHSHILPEMDDGSKSVEESLTMLALYSDRITDLVLTPHFYPRTDTPTAFFERRDASSAKFLAALEGKKHPRLHFGAEVAYFEGIHNSEDMEKLCISDSRLLLVEMPFSEWNRRMIGELIDLYRTRNIRPVLAHIDRYNFGGSDRRLLAEYLAADGLVQVNAEAFTRHFQRRRATRMIGEGMIHFVGSDCHNTDTRKPNLDEALDRLLKIDGGFLVELLDQNAERFFN